MIAWYDLEERSGVSVTVQLCEHLNLMQPFSSFTIDAGVFKQFLVTCKNVFTFGGAKRSGNDRECKYFPIGMNALEPLWR